MNLGVELHNDQTKMQIWTTGIATEKSNLVKKRLRNF